MPWLLQEILKIYLVWSLECDVKGRFKGWWILSKCVLEKQKWIHFFLKFCREYWSNYLPSIYQWIFLIQQFAYQNSVFINFPKSKYVREKKKSPFLLLETFAFPLAHTQRTSHTASGVFLMMNPFQSQLLLIIHTPITSPWFSTEFSKSSKSSNRKALNYFEHNFVNTIVHDTWSPLDFTLNCSCDVSDLNPRSAMFLLKTFQNA